MIANHGLDKIINSIEGIRVNHSDRIELDEDNQKSNEDKTESISFQNRSDMSSANSGCSQEQMYYAQTSKEEPIQQQQQQQQQDDIAIKIIQNDDTVSESETQNEFDQAEGPIIYTDDSDCVSQITSSIAGSSTFSIHAHSNRFNRLSNNTLKSDKTNYGFSSNGMIGPRPGRKTAGSRLKGATALTSNRSVGSKGSLDDLFEVAVAESSTFSQSKSQITQEEKVDKINNSFHDAQYKKGDDYSHNFNTILEHEEEPSVFSLENTSSSFYDSVGHQSDKHSQSHSHSLYSTTDNFSHNNKQALGFVGYAINRIIRGIDYIQQQYVSSKKKKDDDLASENDEDYFGSIMSGSVFQPQNYLSSTSSLSNPYHRADKKKFYQTIVSLLGLFILLTIIILLVRVSFTDDNDRTKSTTYFKTNRESVAESNKWNDVIEFIPQFNDASVNKNHIGMDLPKIFDVFAEVDDLSLDKASNLPFFWHIPRTGGGTMNDILADCLQLTLASNAGVWEGHGHDEVLKVVKFDHSSYVNVDLSTTDGIERAKQLSMIDSGLADVAVSSLLYEAATLFTEVNKGRMFALFRHPVERAVSLFHFVQDTQWRRSATKNHDLADIKIEEFFKGGLAENNWMTRFLSNQLTKGSLDENDLDLAKEVLRRKCLVGILKEKGESFSRFEQYFGWQFISNADSECYEKKLEWAWPLKHRHEEVEEGTELWEIIVMQNEFDIQLYEYVEYLFHEQRIFFSGNE